MMEATSTPSMVNPITAVGGPVPAVDECCPSKVEHEQRPFSGDKKQEVYRVATELFRQDPDWVTFFREVLGIDGVARRLFSSKEELAALEQTDEYSQIQQMLAKLRARSVPPPDDSEPTRVITVRLPKSLHESLRTEAHERQTSMNKLCISKLLQMVEPELIPEE